MKQGKVVGDIEEMLSVLGYCIIYDKSTSSLGQTKGGFREFTIYKE